ncbi:MarR family winged helix-turn-helix transcriptional regulator [Actinomycetospora chiangmaiensis]|uniref:MarR family winged helix-turn-helix transcriptional regulator n=1 Tax=Actinomycetospora chiangmaiensis TaxID=402650 RepID=UPI0003797404|nr:MarR family transcriptional regulator [Actinomycetospora chiangmaiensis]
MTEPTHAVDPVRLRAYFALIEVSGLLRHAIEQQLQADGDLTFVRFQILRRLQLSPAGRQRMTDLADAIVFSRSGLTYQAGLLEKVGLVVRNPSPDDERGVTIAITDAGRALVDAVMPGHEAVVDRLLFSQLSQDDARTLTALLTPVRDHMREAPPRSARPRRARS